MPEKYTVGTSIFISIGEAQKYYRNLGFDHEYVDEMIQSEGISIGLDEFKLKYPGNFQDKKYKIDGDGRFHLILSR